MKHRTIALLLAGVLTLSLMGTNALAAAADAAAPQEESSAGTENFVEEDVEEYIPDPIGSISFQNVKRRMHEGNLQIKALQESIDMIGEIDYDKLKEQLWENLNSIAQVQWQLITSSSMLKQLSQLDPVHFSYSDYEYHTSYDQLDRAYDALREQFDAIKDGEMQDDNADTVRQLQSLQNQIIKAGEATYIALAAMELQASGLDRQLAALDRQIAELELRFQLGQISSLTLKQAQSGRAALNSGLSTLRMNMDMYKGQFEMLLGADITGTITLGALPKVTQQDLDSMDLEADTATAKENSWDIYQASETMKDDLKTYNNHGGEYGYTYRKNDTNYMQARHTYYTAKYTYDNTIQSFELGLRNLYLKVHDYKQILDAAQTALDLEQDNYAVAQLKHSQGNLSQNGLLEAGDKLREAQEKAASAENDLYSAYNTYRWAVDYGIMN